MGCATSRKEIQQIISTDSNYQITAYKVLKVDPRRPLGDVSIVSIEKPSELSFPLGGGIIFDYENQKIASHMLEYGKDRIKFALLTQNSRMLIPNQEIKYTTFQIQPRLVFPQENVLFISHSLSIPIILQLISIYKIQPLLNSFLITAHQQGDIPYLNVLKKYNNNVVECYKNPIQKMEEMIKVSSYTIQCGPIWQVKETQKLCEQSQINSACLPFLGGLEDVVASQWLLNGEQPDILEYEQSEIEFQKAIDLMKISLISQAEQPKLKPIEIIQKSDNIIENKKPKIKPIMMEKQKKQTQIVIDNIEFKINLSNFQQSMPYPFDMEIKDDDVIKQVLEIKKFLLAPFVFNINLQNFKSQMLYPFNFELEDHVQYCFANTVQQNLQIQQLLEFESYINIFDYIILDNVLYEILIQKNKYQTIQERIEQDIIIYDQVVDDIVYDYVLIQQDIPKLEDIFDFSIHSTLQYDAYQPQYEQINMQKYDIEIYDFEILEQLFYQMIYLEYVLKWDDEILLPIVYYPIVIEKLWESEYTDYTIYQQIIAIQPEQPIDIFDMLVQEQIVYGNDYVQKLIVVQKEIIDFEAEKQFIFEFDYNHTIYYEEDADTNIIIQSQNVYEFQDNKDIFYDEIIIAQQPILSDNELLEGKVQQFLNDLTVSQDEQVKRRHAYQIFLDVDISQDKKIDIMEARLAFQKYSFQEEDIIYVMGLVDADDNSILNFIEFYRFISILTAYNNDVDIKQILFIAADSNLSGNIDAVEFEYIMKKLNAFIKFGEDNVKQAIKLVIGQNKITRQEFDSAFDLVKKECKKNM
ncbi:hypothetical protein SS50377_24441 [Spironucleus salmonicida]|uniref:EF-hand domain-containing protein n=1 Tax=Spironucleus salmonicida TaxID=348837 RepID=V6LN10_9EUKA|nr:hypothetical protein SS50377_24441 [Spironucleus salmonicida]|eukprot:EST46010.1 Hypothetical protein SS50377_13996 [Spironucleus salmonicida]